MQHSAQSSGALDVVLLRDAAGGRRVKREPQPLSSLAAGVSADVRTFIDALRQRHMPAERVPQPGPRDDVVRQVAHGEDLVFRFTRAATRMGCKLHTTSPDGVAMYVARLLGELGARSIWLDPLLADLRLDGPAITRELPPPAGGTRDDTLFAVDAAVTGVSLAIAETGSLVCESGPRQPRGATLIPPLHIAIVRAEQIVPDVADAIAHLAARPSQPANAVLITGPSKTADVEGVLVTGVHGPGQVHVVLVSARASP